MGRRIDQVELIDYVLARLVSRFLDHGETLEDSAAFAEFWCHKIGEELPGFEVRTRDGAIVAETLLQVSSAQATKACLLCRRQ